MWDIIIPAVAGLISGVIGSIFAPWANWRIEKKRLQQTSRANLIAEARSVLANSPPSKEFRMMPIYSRLKPYLSEASQITIEGKFNGHGEASIIIVGCGRHSGVNPYAQLVLDEISNLESKWKLI